MKIAVIGTGGVGGSFGAALAKAEADVTFVARGAHLAAMRKNGLRVEGGRGEMVICPAQATDDIAFILMGVRSSVFNIARRTRRPRRPATG